jgi:hypothetical protein
MRDIDELQPRASAYILIGLIHSLAQGRLVLTRRPARILYRNDRLSAANILDSRPITKHYDVTPYSTTTLTHVFAILLYFELHIIRASARV